MRYVLHNPVSSTAVEPTKLAEIIKSKDPSKELKLVSVIDIKDYKGFFDSLQEGDDIVLCGGDGTLYRFANRTDFENFNHDVYLYKAGNGNDFLNDVNGLKEDFIKINQYLVNLPKVTLNGETTKYINGIGFGVDGMVCVEGAKVRAAGKVPNYTSIAVKLCLFGYKPVNAHVVVDGKAYDFKRVFICSAMNGRYYGGGMKEAPDQDRLGNKLSCVVWHDFTRLGGLMNFSKIFTGEHVKNTKHITVITGNRIEVTFDKPTGLQIDGDPFDGVTSYIAVK